MLSDGDGCLNQPALTKKKKKRNSKLKVGKRKGFPTNSSKNQQLGDATQTYHQDLTLDQRSCQGLLIKRGNASSVP